MSTLLYNPDRKDKQDLISEFVVRTNIFSQIFEDIKSGKMKHPEQNYLLLGQRGSGKTTLITRLKYAIEDDTELNKWLIPIVFSEEQYNISELVNVWESIAIFLEDYHGFTGLSEEVTKCSYESEFEALAFDTLIKHLEKHAKKIVLFIDNIGDMLAKFTELDVRRLREILQSKPYIRLIAGSSVVLESVVDYHQPLYEFFKVIQLKGLTFEESVSLLKKLAEIHNERDKIEGIIRESPARIETLRTLSGGIPRTIALLFQVFVDTQHGNALSDLEKVLDAVTPLYKHRMDDLPAQQQKIIDAVARNWDAVSVKTLAEKLRLESKIISSQLRQLEKNQIIEKRSTNTKNHIYLIRERFFNVWYLMRYGRKQDRQRVIWLVKFLEAWCDGKEIEKRILDYVDKAKKGLIDSKTLELYGEAYSFFEKVGTQTRILLKESTPNYISKKVIFSDSEFDETFDSYVERREWDKIIGIAITREKFTRKQISKISDLFKTKDSTEFFELFLLSIKSYRGVEKLVDNKLKVPAFYLIGVSEFNSVTLISCLEKGDEVEVKKCFNGLIEFYKNLSSASDDYAVDSMNRYVYLLLVFKYYNMALSFYKDHLSFDEITDNRHKFMYLTTLYFVGDKNEDFFEKYGSELKDPILNIVNNITGIQNGIPVTLSKLNLYKGTRGEL